MADHQKISNLINHMAGTEKNGILDILHMLNDAIRELEYNQTRSK